MTELVSGLRVVWKAPISLGLSTQPRLSVSCTRLPELGSLSLATHCLTSTLNPGSPSTVTTRVMVSPIFTRPVAAAANGPLPIWQSYKLILFLVTFIINFVCIIKYNNANKVSVLVSRLPFINMAAKAPWLLFFELAFSTCIRSFGCWLASGTITEAFVGFTLVDAYFK